MKLVKKCWMEGLYKFLKSDEYHILDMFKKPKREEILNSCLIRALFEMPNWRKKREIRLRLV